MQEIEYGGWARNLHLTNGEAELLVTLDVGPRIMRYQLAGGVNVMKEFTEQLGKSGEPEWCIRGGHRLWTAPEDLTRTYAPDNAPIEYKPLDSGGVRFTPPADRVHGVLKEIDVHLAQSGSQVKLTHRITNVGDSRTELAPWALTVLAPGGVGIVPLPPKRPHPGHVRNAKSPSDFAPNQRLILWPFTDLSDPRWTLGKQFILLRHDATRGATKIGLAHALGWTAYLLHHTLFVKRQSLHVGRQYADEGANFETFTNEEVLENESLGPVVMLAPGQHVEHTERWELFGNVPLEADERDEARIARVLGELGLMVPA